LRDDDAETAFILWFQAAAMPAGAAESLKFQPLHVSQRSSSAAAVQRAMYSSTPSRPVDQPGAERSVAPALPAVSCP
jgi:hypothetical protein